jgi:O-antigen ligase
MAGLALEVAWKWLMAFAIVVISGSLFDQLLLLGESALQTAIVLAFYIYCFLCLFCASKHKLFHVLAIPVFTQFLHLFQKYSFPAGANSLWRIMPFLILCAYFFHFLLQKPAVLSDLEKWFLTFWIIFQTFFLLISPNLENIAGGGFLIFLLLLPCYFIYLKAVSQANDFRSALEMYFFILFMTLGIGTFGLIFAGAIYKGSENLLATRNIADTNVTMAYFILLWPLTLLYAFGNAGNWLSQLCCFAIFISIVIFSFSRGAVLLITPYLFITAFITRIKVRFWSLAMLTFLVLTYWSDLSTQWKDLDMAYFWTLRFGDVVASNSILAKLQQTSGRAEIHEIAYELFLSRPLSGHGTGSFEILGPGYREAHSLFFTLLAEQGSIGTLAMYGMYFYFIIILSKTVATDRKYALLLTSLIFYLLFNHSVGSVFVILPAKSVTINCIAPVLLMCLYFYANSILTSKTELAET